jgi:hypothetical protein
MHIVRYEKAVPWLRWLVAGFLLRRAEFTPWLVGFVVDEVALGQVFFPTSSFSLSV